MTTDVADRVKCERCDGRGIWGDTPVYRGLCFKCDGVGWYSRAAEKAKRAREREERKQAAADQARWDIENRDRRAFQERYGHLSLHGLQFHNRRGHPKHWDTCPVCTEVLLPSEGADLISQAIELGILFAQDS